MNWGNKVKRTKQVNVSFEWTNKGDLIAILSDLKEFLSSGIETYHDQKKSVEMEDKWHEVEFSQANPTFKFDALIREGIKMEKEQIIEFTNDYVLTQCSADFNGNVSAEMSTEEYYELTFKSE